MGQEEIYKFLKENRGTYFSINEIINKLDDKNRSSVTRSCRKMRQYGFLLGEQKNLTTWDDTRKVNKTIVYTVYKVK